MSEQQIEAEKAVLGAILLDGDRFLDVADRLSARDFFRTEHRYIYGAMRDLATAGAAIDPLTVQERLAARGKLEAVSKAYVWHLTDGLPPKTHIDAYIGIVKDHSTRGRLVAAANSILAHAADTSVDTRELIDRAEGAVFAVAQEDTRGDFVDADTLVREGFPAIEQLLEKKQGLTGIPSGFADFDDMTRGLHPGTLALVAARPSMGKTSFALNVAFQAARAGYHTGFFSLEMSREELFIRLVAAVARVDSHRLQSGYINQTDFTRISEAITEIATSKLHVDESPNVGVLDVRGKSRRLGARHDLRLIILDYLQLMQVPKAENRNLAMAEVSRSLKLLARELKIPVMALSQLSRETERRGDKRPMLSDLRDSGALEQDADLVVFIHRPEVYKETDDNAGLAEIVIAKHRNGPTGTVKLRWSKESTRFDNWTAALPM